MDKAKHSTNSKKSKVNLTMISQIVFLIEVVAMIGGIIYTSIMQLLPTKYLFILIALAVVVCGIHCFLLLHKKAVRTLRVFSLILSVIVLFVVVASTYMLGILYTNMSGMQSEMNGEGESSSEIVDAPKADVTSDPFIVYLSGLDTRGVSEIKDKGRSDVNMLMAVNPVTKQLLMVNIPRDYYLPLYGDANKMDKLTHAGSYGVDCSMKTVGTLFGVQCNYYVKVNFQSVVDIVDALGGVTVNSEFNFSSNYSLSGTTYSFHVGENNLTGDSALAFARERYNVPGGDRQRGKHQQMVISAILDEAMSPSILNPSNLKNVLSAITGNTKTNMSYDDISSLVRMQLNNMSGWDIDSISVDGTGSSGPCYAAGGQSLSVILPNMDTVTAAKSAINAVMYPNAAS